MNKLSVDILYLIFKYLDYKQKLQCKLVCSTWAHVLRSDRDLATLVISTRNESSTSAIASARDSSSFIQKAQNDKSTFKNYRRLTLSDYYDVFNLVTLFPNLNFLYFPSRNEIRKNNESMPTYTKDHSGHFRHWHNNLKTFIDFSCYDLLFNFLDTGVFHHLTTLILVSGTRTNLYKFTSWTHKLRNAPNLESLHVHGVILGISELEILHKNVPLLNTLLLSTCIIDSNWEQPTEVLSANTMKKFEIIKYAGSDGFSMELAKYIVYKYPNLKKFAFKMHECGRRGNKDRDILWASSFLHLIQGLGVSLKSFKIWLPISTPQIYTGLIENTKALRKLNTNIFNDETLLDKAVYSGLILGLRSLTLAEVPSLTPFTIYNKLTSLKVLKLKFMYKLKVDGSKFCVRLNELTNDLPKTLETLGLTSVDLCVNSLARGSDSNIRHLKLKFSRIKSDLSNCLSRHFPKLDTLILDRCPTKFNMDLSQHHLVLVKLYVYKSLIVLTGDELVPKCVYSTRTQYGTNMKAFRRKAAFDVHDHSMYTTCKVSPLVENEEYFYFKCASVRTLLLGEELVSL